MTPRVTVAVPTITQPPRLDRCLQTMREVAAGDAVDIDLVVVLDGAEADVRAWVQANVDDATVLSWPERRGVAAALNAAMRASSTPFLAVLQDDALPQAGWLASLLATAGEHVDAGAIGGLTLWPDGSVQGAGSVILGDGSTFTAWCGDPPPASVFDAVRSVDYVGSSSLLVRRETWAAVGGFDEEMYPAIFVDADFATALWQAGWKVLFDPGSRVVHQRHGSMSTRFRDYVYQRNRARFVMKWGQQLAGRAVPPVDDTVLRAEVERAACWLTDPPPATRPPAVAPVVEGDAYVYADRERRVVGELVDLLDRRMAELEAVYAQWIAVEAHARALEARVAELERRPGPGGAR